jgi:hypothetical protein
MQVILPPTLQSLFCFLDLVTSRVARYFLVQYTNVGKYIPNYHKIYQMSIKYTNGGKIDQKYTTYIHRKIYEPFAMQGPPKFIHIVIFGLKIYHLATLVTSRVYLPTLGSFS